jgi:hypothetical protein
LTTPAVKKLEKNVIDSSAIAVWILAVRREDDVKRGVIYLSGGETWTDPQGGYPKRL